MILSQAVFVEMDVLARRRSRSNDIIVLVVLPQVVPEFVDESFGDFLFALELIKQVARVVLVGRMR